MLLLPLGRSVRRYEAISAPASSGLRTWLGVTPNEHEAPGNRRRSAASNLARSVFRRCDLHFLLEKSTERSEAGEADEEADLRHGEVRVPKKLARTFEPSRGKVVPRRTPVGIAKCSDEVEPRVAGSARDRVEVERLRIGAVHEVFGIAKVREPLHVGRHRADMARDDRRHAVATGASSSRARPASCG